MNKINIVIPALGGKEWTGGLTYQENLIEALRTQKDVCVYVLNSVAPVSVKRKSNRVKDRLTLFFRQGTNSLNYQISKLLFGFNKLLNRELRQFASARTNVLFTHNDSYLDIRNNFIKLYWIPDFQHVHLPHLFSANQINDRNKKFIEGCRKSDIIILSSKSAQEDLEKFAPQYVSKSRVSNFVAGVKENLWSKDPSILLERYFLPSKFFFLPNQFWKHKNHIVVFKALNYLKERGINPTIICTGNPSEFRNPGYYAELTRMIKEWEIGDQIRVLGLVPHEDVILLIRQSIAVINPSYFEGWSTTVEESKSLGKHLILSDIPVHREQAPGSVDYFPPDDYEYLARLLNENWNKLEPGPKPEQETKARNELPERRKEYAENFLSIIREYQRHKDDLPEPTFFKPILFLIFNRPQHTKVVFEILRRVRPAQLFIAADGPRPGFPEDTIKCEEARQIIHSIDWKCDVRLLFRETNLSLKEGVSSAINWFFENVEEGIILEDDCLADESFFDFCSQMLDRYRDNEKIMHINGTNFLLGKEFDFDGSYYFSRICHPWGWATWKRAWKKYDITMKNLNEFLNENKIGKFTDNQEAIKFYSDNFRKTAEGRVNTWDYQWFYSVWNNDGLVISPAFNMVSNIGFGKDATHTNYKYTRLSRMKRNRVIHITHPASIKVNRAADEYSLRINIKEGMGNLLERLIVKTKLTIGIKEEK